MLGHLGPACTTRHALSCRPFLACVPPSSSSSHHKVFPPFHPVSLTTRSLFVFHCLLSIQATLVLELRAPHELSTFVSSQTLSMSTFNFSIPSLTTSSPRVSRLLLWFVFFMTIWYLSCPTAALFGSGDALSIRRSRRCSCWRLWCSWMALLIASRRLSSLAYCRQENQIDGAKGSST